MDEAWRMHIGSLTEALVAEERPGWSFLCTPELHFRCHFRTPLTEFHPYSIVAWLNSSPSFVNLLKPSLNLAAKVWNDGAWTRCAIPPTLVDVLGAGGGALSRQGFE